MTDKINGIGIFCDLNGKVLKIVYDGLGIGEYIKTGELFLKSVDEGSTYKASNFIEKIVSENAAFNWELNIQKKQENMIIHFSGCVVSDHILIIGVKSLGKMYNLIEELSKMNSEQGNVLRIMTKDLLIKLNKEDYNSYDEISRLNNELTNTKRELTKTNFKLNETNLKLEKSLKEKEILLKEIHHRVKNNLMVISSLLNIQSRYIKNKDDLDLFRESQNRARSMALIHERLYSSDDLKSINFGEYIRTLSTELFRTYTRDSSRLKLNLNVENEVVDINTTVPLGLILNELITNSMKHAFPDSREGEITIKFHKKDDEFVLIVSDNGIGFPADLDFQNTQSMGLQLVNTLSEQINGKIKLNKKNGTAFTIKFSENVI